MEPNPYNIYDELPTRSNKFFMPDLIGDSKFSEYKPEKAPDFDRELTYLKGFMSRSQESRFETQSINTGKARPYSQLLQEQDIPIPYEGLYNKMGETALFGLGISPADPLGSTLPSSLLAPDLEVSNSERYTQARAFRRARLRAGALGELIDSIPGDGEVRGSIAPFLASKDMLVKGTYRGGETHRDLAALFGGLMTASPELRDRTMTAIDATAADESDRLKAEIETNEVRADVIIVGAGIHGSVMAATIRSQRPDARIITIDKSAVLGGQFRKYGQRPAFYINSRNHRPQVNDVPGLPDGDGNLNPFGSTAPLHITDIAAETYPTNVDLGNTAAINQYLSSETMLSAEVISIDGDSGKVEITDSESGKAYSLFGEKIVMATGLGERTTASYEPDNLWTAERLLGHFANPDEPFPMQQFIGKKVAIIGGGDTGRVSAELFARLAPAAAYGRSVTQLGGPDKVTWFGTEFNSREEFCDTNRPRYQRLASFIAGQNSLRSSFVIEARGQRIANIDEMADGSLSIIEESGLRFEGFDIVIDARTLPDPQREAGFIANSSFYPLQGSLSGYSSEIGRSTLGDTIYLAGPAAQTTLNFDEQRRFADGIKENTASIWANTPRSEEMALRIARDLPAKAEN